ncbi:MAG TPA: choice-of-anchor X domain-containing protein, partial [Mycobacterium sp.]|nr:choice-of-anchor X domain-containing protein [Mycobacterium sp.]
IPDPEAGKWKLHVRVVETADKLIPYRVLVSAQSSLTLHLLLPGMYGAKLETGDEVPIVAFLSDRSPIAGAIVSATITGPQCERQFTWTNLPLFDDGEHGDGNAEDGVYANLFTRVNCAEVAWPPTEGDVKPSQPDDEGAYSVLVRATSPKFQREAKGAFAVLEGADDDKDSIPDAWEKEHGVSDPQGDPDPDRDSLNNYLEYLNGTDPNDSDTDDGGENDGSEVNSSGHDPLDPADDGIKPPDFLQVTPFDGKVRLLYDVKPGYALMRLWRATLPGGAWNPLGDGLKPTGIYTDTATNDTKYHYLLAAEGASMLQAAGPTSALVESEAVTPSEDPVPPQAWIVIDDGAPVTYDRDVTLSFVPWEYEEGDPDGFSDIAWYKVSNDPSFAGVEWRPITADEPAHERVDWVLGGEMNSVNRVYVRFRDVNLNESVGTEVGSIYYQQPTIYLPLVTKSP